MRGCGGVKCQVAVESSVVIRGCSGWRVFGGKGRGEVEGGGEHGENRGRRKGRENRREGGGEGVRGKMEEDRRDHTSTISD